MNNQENRKLPEEKLAKVAGGGFYDEWSNEDYIKGGVELVGIGYLRNDGYKFHGQNITYEQANYLAFYAYLNGHPANSVEEAKEFYDYMSYMNSK